MATCDRVKSSAIRYPDVPDGFERISSDASDPVSPRTWASMARSRPQRGLTIQASALGLPAVTSPAASIVQSPDRYHPRIYGLTEVGGTSVLYLSPVPFEELDFDTTVAEFPLPDLTWRLLLHVPNVVLLGAGFLGASYWLYRRREEVAASEELAALQGGAQSGGEDD